MSLEGLNNEGNLIFLYTSHTLPIDVGEIEAEHEGTAHEDDGPQRGR
jgi:hypothetical protein